MLRKYALLLVIPLGLAGCADMTQKDQAAYMKQALTGAETGWVGFLTFCNSIPPETVKACDDPEIVKEGREKREKTYAAVKAYDAAASTDQPADVVTRLLNEANAAVAAFQAFESPLPKGVN